jgi:AmmeMemoRadiSam system protein B
LLAIVFPRQKRYNSIRHKTPFFRLSIIAAAGIFARNKQMIRRPAVAGQFYAGTRRECLAEINECLPKGPLSMALPETIVAGIVPHAGWVFSGDLAAMVFAAIKQIKQEPDTFILFGAAHGCCDMCPVIFPEGAWETPLGQIEIDAELTSQLIALGARPDAQAHRHEHSIEVQVPFIQHLFPKAKLVAAIMPPASNGYECDFGHKVGTLLKTKRINAVCIASTDLTHYGPRYGFAPKGTDSNGIHWAHSTNDMDFINHALHMDAEHLLQSSLEHENACGPAGAAAAIAAAKALGRTQGYLLPIPIAPRS